MSLPAIKLDRSIDRASVQKLIDSFLGGRSSQTLEAYSSDLLIFAKFFKKESVVSAVETLIKSTSGEANSLILDFKNSMIEKGYASATINRRLAAIRSLVRLAKTLGLNQFEIEIPNMKVIPYRDTRGPLSSDVQAILDVLLNKKTAKSARDISIIRLLHDLGLRVSELTGLDISDFDEANGTLAVLGKGRREKVLLELPESTKTALYAWLEFRGKTPGPLYTNFVRRPRGQDQLGLTHTANRLSRQGVRDIVIALAKAARVSPKSPHGYRHRSITEAIKRAQAAGLGLEDVLDHSRHSRNSMSALMAYLDRINNVQGKISKLVAEQVNTNGKDDDKK